MNDINLQNTYISFTPSFLGNGWETSLLPRFEKGRLEAAEFRISFGWLKKLFLKTPVLRQEKGLEMIV